MKKILPILILAGLCISFVTFIVMSDKPIAQEDIKNIAAVDGQMKIVVLDVQHLLNNSKAAESIREQAVKLTKEFEEDLKKLDTDLRAEHKKIIDDNKDKSKTDKIKAREKFEVEIKKANAKANEKREKVANAVNKATQELRNAILEIVAKEAPAKGYDLILTRGDVVIVSKEYDITSDVMAQLNDKVDTIKLEVK